MTDKKASPWLAIEKTERYQDYKRGRNADNPTQPDGVTAAAKRREQLLKNRLLETRIAGNVVATKQRGQKLADERDAIIDGAIADAEKEHNARVLAIHETATSIVSRFFLVGLVLTFGFCLLGIVGFCVLILVGIVGSLFGIV